MNIDDFKRDLVKSAFDLAGQQGWRRMSVAAAARHGGHDLALARQHFVHTGKILEHFGRLADTHALTGAMSDGPVRDRIFDIVMRRFDFLQQHREGVVALMRHAPTDPFLALWLERATVASIGWMLEGAGVSSRGLRGNLRKAGLLAASAWALRAWIRDDSPDLSATMAALDEALMRADEAASQFGGARTTPAETTLPPEPDVSFDTHPG